MSFLRRYFAVTWAARTWREIAYLVVGLPFAILWFSYVVTMYTAGIGLVVVWVGLVILVAVQATLRRIGNVERFIANRMNNSMIEQPGPQRYRIHAPGRRPSVGDWGRWFQALVHDTHSWRVLVWVLGRIVIGPLGFVVGVIGAVAPITIVATLVIALMYKLNVPVPLGLPDGNDRAAQMTDLVTFWILFFSPLLLALVPTFGWMVRGCAALTAMLARWSLGPTADERMVQVTERAELAETQVRIDQELHDSIGHMITMNVIQAGAGAHVFDTDPDFARTALRNIEERGRVAMGELDRIIATIRGDDDESRTPLPTIEDLPALIEQSQAAGIKVETRFEVTNVPETLSRAAYAIVREGVTNAAKHAPGATVHVHTAMLPDALALCIRNGPAPKGTPAVPAVHTERVGGGRGIVGIRDRAVLLGGASRIGRLHGGGYEVMVLLALELGLDPQQGAASDAECCKWSRARGTVSS